MIEDKIIFNALTALRQYIAKHYESQPTRDLFDQEENAQIQLQISIKKIPALTQRLFFKILLPHPFVPDLKDVCLFTTNLNKKYPDDDQTINYFQELLQSKGISLGQIIPYHQLCTEYKTFEARRYLVRAYKTFLTEGSISKMLPSALGKTFIRKRKMPVSVCLKPKFVEQEIWRGLSKTTLTLSGLGSSLLTQVGVLKQKDSELVSNVLAVANFLDESLPGQWDNVHALYLKTDLPFSLPIYLSSGSANDVVLPRNEGNLEPVEDEVNTLTRSRVKVYPSGKVVLVPTGTTDDVHNEYEKEEKKALSNLRYKQNKKQRIAEMKRNKPLNPFKNKKKKGQDKSPKKKKVQDQVSKPKSVLSGKSIFGLPSDPEKKKTKIFNDEELNSTFSPDKTFDDSFQLHARKTSKTDLLTRLSQSADDQDSVDGSTEQNDQVKGKRSRKLVHLPSIKRSYSTAQQSRKKASQDVELLHYKKNVIHESPEKAQEETDLRENTVTGLHSKKLKSGAKKMEKRKPEKKISRFASIRQSVKLAKQLL